MTQERGKRRRGRRRPGGSQPEGAPPPADAQQSEGEEDLEVSEESEATGARRPRFGLRRRQAGKEPAGRRRSRTPEKRPAAAASSSPMDFWRSGQVRSYRDVSRTQRRMGLWQRISGFHFPAWFPVVTIIVVVFAILGGLFYFRTAVGAPRNGDHWHAPYAIFIGDELQPRIQEVVTPQGIHTHGDGVIHIHPHQPSAEGSGARIANFFADQGGKLTDSEMRIPGRRETYKNGDPVDGRPAELRILRADSGHHPLGANFNQAILDCNNKPESEYERVNSRYVPKDGDCIRIVFAPPEVEPVVQPDRTIIDPATADREIRLEITGSGAESIFNPASFEVAAGETVKVVLRNAATEAAFHGLRFAGADGGYGTSDDFVLEPPTLDPGQEGTAVIRFNTPGEYEFRDEQAIEGVTPVVGKVIVGEATSTPGPETTPTPVPADLSLDVISSDTVFEPAQLAAGAGQSFRLTLTNNGTVVHNLRVAGPDGAFRTEDDIVISPFVNPGAKGEVFGKIDQPGTYAFRDDFHQEITGTLTIQ